MPAAFRDAHGNVRSVAAPALTGLDDDRGACQCHEDHGDTKCLGLDDGPHHQSHRIPAPTLRTREARIMRTQLKRASFVFTIDPFIRRVAHRLGRRPGSLWRDPWLCVPASRRVCPGRSCECGAEPRVSVLSFSRSVVRMPQKYWVPSAFGGVVPVHRVALSRRPPACYRARWSTARPRRASRPR